MMKREKNRVCPVELAGSLDNKVRRLFQNPGKILVPYIAEGMKVLDIGCGPGYFTIEIAKIIGNSGKVFAMDLQEGMLQNICDKIKGTELENRIFLIKNEKDSFGIPEKVDFILAFYMVHEVPDKEALFKGLKGNLKKNGQLLLVEPKLFHVSRKEFKLTIEAAEKCGFETREGPKLLFSFSAILKNT